MHVLLSLKHPLNKASIAFTVSSLCNLVLYNDEYKSVSKGLDPSIRMAAPPAVMSVTKW